jgi:hypothetical protein
MSNKIFKKTKIFRSKANKINFDNLLSLFAKFNELDLDTIIKLHNNEI